MIKQLDVRTHLKARFLVPMSALLLISLASSLYFTYQQLKEGIEDSLNLNLVRVAQIFNKESADQAETLKILIKQISKDRALLAAMQRQNRNELTGFSIPLWQQLKATHGLDHLYLLTPEKRTMLRAHQPDFFGDTIERQVIAKAAELGEPVASLELGPMGILALRVAAPLYDDGKLLGFVELSKHVERLLNLPLAGTRTFITLYKNQLTQSKWERGANMRGSKSEWERFPTLLLSSPANEEELKALSRLLSQSTHAHFEISSEITLDDRVYRTGTVPIHDSTAQEVGDIIVLTDITEQLTIHNREMRNISIAATGASIVLIIFSYLLLGRIERKLEASRLNLVEAGIKREKMQQQHLKELHVTLKKAQTAEETALKMMAQAQDSRNQLNESFVESINTLMRAAEYRDDETGAHVRRIAHYSKIMAEKLGMDEAFCDQIYYASAMHDIGKIGIADDILLKPGHFEADEWEIMKTHTVIGAKILAGNSSPYLRMGEEIARSHHERWDGSGYPDGLVGEQIPLPARIMQLADIYDALRSKRPYKPQFSHQQAMDIICNGDGRTDPAHFDPRVLEAFIACSEQLEKIYDQHDEEI